MKIYTLWQHDGSEDVPWMIAACDEFTVEAHSGFPPDYENHRGPGIREMVIEIPTSVAVNLFNPALVEGVVK